MYLISMWKAVEEEEPLKVLLKLVTIESRSDGFAKKEKRRFYLGSIFCVSRTFPIWHFNLTRETDVISS